MLLTKKVLLKIHHSKVNFYNELGYICKPNDFIQVKIEDLSYGSRIKIKCKCDICGIKKEISYAKYNKNIKNGGIYTCNTKCAQIKNRKTNLKKYGHEYSFSSELVKDKIKETNLKKYGFENQFQTNEFREKMLKFGRITNTSKTEFQAYRLKVDNLTNKVKKYLFENWNGHDYYDNEYIKNNLNLHYNSKNYPTIDHKISVYYGFINNIPVEIIANIENLCITKRIINTKKSILVETVFINKFN
jgi:hypothetical protein